jgi:hypothetical protein
MNAPAGGANAADAEAGFGAVKGENADAEARLQVALYQGADAVA